MKFSSDKNGTFNLKNINANSFEVSYVPNAEGINKITVVVDSQTLTYDLNVLKTTVYGKNITKVQGDVVNYTAVFKDLGA